MCGATSAQTQLQQEQMDFYATAQKEAQQTFGEQQSLLANIKSVYDPILKAGPNQEGFSEAEENSLNTEAIEGTAKNYANAERAINQHIAAENGANPIPTGAQEQSQQEEALASAGQESTEEQQILQADYATGRQNFEAATAAEETAAGLQNPTGFESGATSAGGAASTTANEIAQENNSWVNAALGAAGGLASSVVDMNPKGIFG